MGKFRDQVRQVLVENGLDSPGSLHSWRCEHPGVYGPCDCLEELLDDLAGVIFRIREEAWAEGYTHCFDCPEPGSSLEDNPYREQTRIDVAPNDKEPTNDER